MRGKYYTDTNPYEEQIRELQSELCMARHTIVYLMSEEIQEILNSYHQLKSSSDIYRWENESAYEIIEYAKILSPEEGSYWQDRAYCPLCDRGAQSTYERGFTVPEGLFRHLVGWGNAQRCSVFEAAMALARDFSRRTFGESEEAERQEKLKLIEERKKRETLYKISPLDEPVLLDDGFWSGDKMRDEKEMRWAEERLSSLGFEIRIDERVTAYIDESHDAIVFADPRKLGEIRFTLYRKPLPKKNSRSYRMSPKFYIKDNWRHDLPKKYQVRLQQAQESLR